MIRCLLATLIVFLSVAGCKKNASSGDQAVVRVSLQPIPAYAPLWIAKQKGWFETELKTQALGGVQWLVMRDGPLQNEAFAAGQIDVALMGDTPAIIGRSAGLTTRIISIASFSPASLAVLVQADSTVGSVADLKGKRIGVTKGSFCHHLLALTLQRSGLTLADVRFINMAAPDINTALQTKEIDAGVTWEPYITQLTGQGIARVLTDGTGLKRGDEVIVANEPFASTHAKAIETLLRVYQRGAAFIKDNPDEAATIVSDAVKLTPDEVRATFDKSVYRPGLRDDDLVEFSKSEAFLRELGLTRSPVEISTLTDPTYAKAAGLQ